MIERVQKSPDESAEAILSQATDRLRLKLGDAKHAEEARDMAPNQSNNLKRIDDDSRALMQAMDDMAALGETATLDGILNFLLGALKAMADDADPGQLHVGKHHTLLGRMYSMKQLSLDQQATMTEKRLQAMTKMREKFGVHEGTGACAIDDFVFSMARCARWKASMMLLSNAPRRRQKVSGCPCP